MEIVHQEGVTVTSFSSFSLRFSVINLIGIVRTGSFTLNKSKRSKQALLPLNVLAWDNGRGHESLLLVLLTHVMINRSSWGHPYCAVRGEIRGSAQDEHLRKHLARMFPLIKN